MMIRSAANMGITSTLVKVRVAVPMRSPQAGFPFAKTQTQKKGLFRIVQTELDQKKIYSPILQDEINLEPNPNPNPIQFIAKIISVLFIPNVMLI